MLELLLVLIILVLAYSLASPLISNLGGGDLRSSARTVAVALKRARNVAISARKETPLTFKLDDRTITLAGEPKPFQLPPKTDLQLYTVQKELTNDKIAASKTLPLGTTAKVTNLETGKSEVINLATV